MNKIIYLTVFLVTFVNSVKAQKEDVDKDKTLFFDVRFTTSQFTSNFDSLSFYYKDQEIDPHVFSHNITLRKHQTLYGFDFNTLGITTSNGIHWSGYNMAFYFSKHVLVTNWASGIGYLFKVKSKWEITPFLGIGMGRLAYTFDKYENTTDENVVINNHLLEGDVDHRLIHNSFTLTPQLAIDYHLYKQIYFRFLAGYRFDVASYETIKFIETGTTGFYVVQTANVGPNNALLHHGQYINKDSKVFNINGYILSFGAVWAF